MMQVNILQAKTEFSKLVHILESGREDTIIVSRYGKPVAQITRYQETSPTKRIGIAKGKFKSPVDIDRDNEEIAALMTGGKL